jgi:osmotically-inducible protein OsmY
VKVPGVGSPTATERAKTIAHIDAGKIEVGIESGDVTLTDAVRCWGKREDAEAAAWKAGVTSARNDIRIEPIRAI